VLLGTGCSHGADVTITPPASALIIDAVRAADGKYNAVELRGYGPGEFNDPRFPGILTVREGNKMIGEIRLCSEKSTGCVAPTTTTVF
jgi:hypothetical protein